MESFKQLYATIQKLLDLKKIDNRLNFVHEMYHLVTICKHDF